LKRSIFPETALLLAAASISSKLASDFPKRMLLSIVSENKNGFCGTYPISERSAARL